MDLDNSVGRMAAVNTAVGIGGTTFATLTLNEWAALATFIYMAASTVLLLPKYMAWWESRKKDKG